ncbi:bifunctional diguanylate cyclase/phosphodiesterase [Haliea sp. E1-2-M8]|uniref:putative bifunctional diguanylate cyclase/phosphodiesterase n=1 Tax=Haliea sp. E1-2-M8 TaxID=3064706 RepID=UPI00271BE7CF|nr:bifunctional diguanylate cyclase/phosphodiesterase [Haliea sp. E1-2-M8]MDO8860306.1 bifunctional diguanylate cyclase/phosphodiesterase [Haliea sp. E1-2-M8]
MLNRLWLSAKLFTHQRSWTRHILYLTTIAVLLAVSLVLVFYTGGARSPYSYAVVLPALLGAAWFGVPGGFLTALLGALLLGLYVPLDTIGGEPQGPGHWLPRLVIFVFIGVIAGALHDRLRRQAQAVIEAERVDPMTGLPNLFALRAELDSSLGHRSADESRMALMLLRATDLAEIIDVIGLGADDKIMHEVAQYLLRVCPEVTGVYRFGGSELGFVIRAKDAQTLKRVAPTLHQAAAATFEVDGMPIRIEPAIGIGHVDINGEPWTDELIRRARVALRHATTMEREWVAYEPRIESNQKGTMELIAGVEQALQAGEFELHYQPKMRLADGQPAGAEALARWRQPSGEIVLPLAYILKLEQTSLIDEFSRFVIRAAIDYAGSGLLIPVSINLAARNVGDEDLIDTLIDSLQASGTPAAHFEVEVTESALMRDPETTTRMLARLRAAGIGVCIDDFGTGFASFGYLRRLPATNVKIDREFISPLEADAKARRLMQSIVEVGHALGLTVTAEGVETEGQARILADLGCDYGQGFLWSAAQPADGLQAWLDANDFAVGHRN